MGRTKRPRVPGASPCGGAGRENREAGEKPARDRRRKGESRVQHATAGTRGKADAGRGTQAGRPALGRISVPGGTGPAPGRTKRQRGDQPIISAAPHSERLCCSAPLQCFTGGAFYHIYPYFLQKEVNRYEKIFISLPGSSSDMEPGRLRHSCGLLRPLGRLLEHRGLRRLRRVSFHPDHQRRGRGHIHARP